MYGVLYQLPERESQRRKRQLQKLMMLKKLLNQRRRRLIKRSKHLKNKLLVLIYHIFKMNLRT